MPNNDYANEPNQSRSEDIIQSILDNTEYDEPARSRIEYLLVELKNAIEGGGGGGGVTSYAPLTEKPKIDNHTLQAGNNTSSDLGLQTKLTFDSAPTESSTNPVTSGGVYTALGTKANSADVYNKSTVDTALGAKADKSTTYTKTEVDTALSSKQNTISDLATIRSGAALGTTAVQPVIGKGLSTNDYTTAEKEKLAGIEAQANKTTVDSALSGTSTNPVQNKVVKSALDGKQATLTTAQLAAVNSGITAEKLTRDENNISSLTANGGGKNKFNIDTAAIYLSDATYTKNSDGTINVTKSTNTIGQINMQQQFLGETGTYIISGCPSGGSSTTYEMLIQSGDSGDTVLGRDYGEGASVYLTKGTNYQFKVVVRANQTLSNKLFKPMISVEGGEYQPFALSNAELTAKEQANENNILYNTNNGVKNLFNLTKASGTYSAVIFTVNSDKTVTVNGTASPANSVFNLDDWTCTKVGTYVVSGTPSGGSWAPSPNTYRIRVAVNGTWKGDDVGNGFTLTLAVGDVVNLQINTSTSYTANNLVFKPMITLKSLYDADSSYQQYAMSNAEITAWILAHS